MRHPDHPVNLSEDILHGFLDSFDSMHMTTSDDDTLPSVGAIAGIAVSAIVVITVTLVVTLYCCCQIKPL